MIISCSTSYYKFCFFIVCVDTSSKRVFKDKNFLPLDDFILFYQLDDLAFPPKCVV